MDRENASDLLVFLAVARERSFTRAAAKLGMSQSALSQIVRNLEERLGVRLLNRTTRSVAPTQAGDRLLQHVGPKFDEMDIELAALGELREKPAGNIRITATEHAAQAILLPALAKILPKYRDIRVEVIVDYGLANIVAQRYDAGIRPGELVEKDMIAVRVGPDLRMAVVGAPSYFAGRKKPRTPQDLTEHDCLNLRLPTHGGLYAWEFEKGRTCAERPGQRSACLQRRRPTVDGGVERLRSDLPDGKQCAAVHLRRAARPGALGLVPAVLRLSSILSEPASALARVRPSRRCPPISTLR